VRERNDKPAEDTKYKIQYEEGANDDKTDEVDPWPSVAQRVVNLHSSSTTAVQCSFNATDKYANPTVRRYGCRISE